MRNIVTLVDENMKNKLIVKNLDPKKTYKIQIKLNDGRTIYCMQELSPERIYEELEVLEFVGIIPSSSFSRVLNMKNRKFFSVLVNSGYKTGGFT